MAITTTDSTNPAATKSLGLALPAVFVIVVYAGFVGVKGLPQSKEIRQLQADLRVLQMDHAEWGDVEEIETRQSEVQKVRTGAAERFEVVRKEGARLSSTPQEDSLTSMSLLIRLTDILEKNGLITTKEQSYGRDARPRLIGFVDDGVRKLQRVMADISRPTTPAPVRLEEIPTGMTIREVIAEQAIRPLGELPKLSLHEIEVWGSYRNLVQALEDISRECDESVVVGLEFRKFEGQEGAAGLRIKLVMNFQSAGPVSATEGGTKSDNLLADDLHP